MMDYETAKQLLDETLKLGNQIDKIISVTKAIYDPVIRGKFQKIVGELAGLSTDIVFGIEKFYPDLIPNR
jgi:hypothetical protein